MHEWQIVALSFVSPSLQKGVVDVEGIPVVSLLGCGVDTGLVFPETVVTGTEVGVDISTELPCSFVVVTFTVVDCLCGAV